MYVNVDANMVLGLLYDALSTAVILQHQYDEMVIMTDDWKG
jgi:hypothetical protein